MGGASFGPALEDLSKRMMLMNQYLCFCGNIFGFTGTKMFQSKPAMKPYRAVSRKAASARFLSTALARRNYGADPSADRSHLMPKGERLT